jgi:hypothetical protein
MALPATFVRLSLLLLAALPFCAAHPGPGFFHAPREFQAPALDSGSCCAPPTPLPPRVASFSFLSFFFKILHGSVQIKMLPSCLFSFSAILRWFCYISTPLVLQFLEKTRGRSNSSRGTVPIILWCLVVLTPQVFAHLFLVLLFTHQGFFCCLLQKNLMFYSAKFLFCVMRAVVYQICALLFKTER